jgi:hypothetical protein
MEGKPSRVWSMVSSDPVEYSWEDGVVTLKLKELDQFEGIVLER